MRSLLLFLSLRLIIMNLNSSNSIYRLNTKATYDTVLVLVELGDEVVPLRVLHHVYALQHSLQLLFGYVAVSVLQALADDKLQCRIDRMPF